MRLVIAHAVMSLMLLIVALAYRADAASARERKRLARLALACWAWPVFVAVILVRGTISLIKDALGVET